MSQENKIISNIYDRLRVGNETNKSSHICR